MSSLWCDRSCTGLVHTVTVAHEFLCPVALLYPASTILWQVSITSGFYNSHPPLASQGLLGVERKKYGIYTIFILYVYLYILFRAEHFTVLFSARCSVVNLCINSHPLKNEAL